MDWGQAGESIAKALSRQYVGVDVLYGTVLGRRDDGTVTVEVDGGTVAARAMASFDVGAAVGRQVMLVSKGGVLTIMGAMATSENSHDFSDAVEDIKTANANIDKIQGDIGEVASQMDGVRQDAVHAAQSAQDAADAAQAASDKADQLAGQVTDIKTTVEGFDGQLDHLSTQVSGAVSTADESLSIATEAKQTADSVSTTATSAYENAQEALTQASSAVQTASKLQTTVEQDYLSKDDAQSTYASKSQLTQTAKQIESTVADTYATKGELSDEVVNRNSAISQSALSIMSQVTSGYVDKATGATYATKTELSQTESSITSTVAETYLSKSDAGKTYATQTQLTQTSSSLTVSIQQAAGDAQSAMSAAQTANQAAVDAQDAATAAQSTADGARIGLNTVNTYFEFDSDGLHVGKRATSASGSAYKTAETLMGADGSYHIKDKDGNTVAQMSADAVALMAGMLTLTYRSDSVQLAANAAKAAMYLATLGSGPINIYTNRNDRTRASLLYLADMYAMLGVNRGSGSASAAGTGGYFLVGMNSAKTASTASICADTLGIRPRGGTQTNVDMARAAAVLSGPRCYRGTTVVTASNGVAVVWTKARFTAAFGVYTSGQTHVSFFNGDYNASGSSVCAGFRGSDRAIVAILSDGFTGQYRIDYAVWQ